MGRPIVTVVLPVYKSAPKLEELVERLSRWEDVEVVVFADEPDDSSIRALSRFDGNAKLMVNGRRIGKARALNAVMEMSRGDVLLFIDGDVSIPKDPATPRVIADEIADVDILDLRKEASGSGLVSMMRYYEFLGINVGSWLFSMGTGRSPGIVGSAFAAKRDSLEKLKGFRRTVWEDVDLAARAFLNGMRFRYSGRIGVKVRTSAKIREWIDQEVRAGIGAGLVLKEYGFKLISVLIRNPRLLMLSAVLFLPSLLLLAANVLTPTDVIYWLATSLTMMVPFVARLNVTFPITLGLGQLVNALKATMASLASFAISSTMMGWFARKLGFKFKLHEYAVYFFIYSPVKLAVFAAGLTYVLLGGRRAPGWKT